MNTQAVSTLLEIVHNEGMLDIETMGKRPGAPILSIGLQLFNGPARELGPTFYRQISLASSMAAGLKPDASTIIWWMKQSDEAREAFKSNNSAYDLDVALLDLAVFLRDNAGDIKQRYLYGNSARFDLGILEAAYDACEIPMPWEHWNERCYRTIKNMNPSVKIERQGTHHHALDDATSQTLHLFKLLDTIDVNNNAQAAA